MARQSNGSRPYWLSCSMSRYFAPLVRALIDDRLEVQIAFPDLRELNDPLKCPPEGLDVTCLQ
jgi:hypothetical protein